MADPIAQARTNLHDALAAHDWSAWSDPGVDVGYGMPTQEDGQQFVSVAGYNNDEEHADIRGTGAPPAELRFELHAWVQVAVPLLDASETMLRSRELVSEFRDVVRADSTLGGAVRAGAIVSREQSDGPFPLSEGSWGELTRITVRCRARRS